MRTQSEIRNPKSEGNPKGRIPNPETDAPRCWSAGWQPALAGADPQSRLEAGAPSTRHFGFRLSGLFRHSAFGFRASTLLALALAFLPLLAVAQAPLPPTHFSAGPVEITGHADLNGDGRADAIVVDRATGTVRVGFQTNDSGALTWTPGRAAGLYEVTGVTAGRLLVTNRDALALTAPAHGRLNLVALDSPTAQPQVSPWTPPGMIGPLSLAAGQVFGTTALEDLLLTATWNGSPENRARLFTNNGAATFGASTLIAESSTRRYEHATRVLLATGATHQVAFLEIVEGGSAILRVLSLNEAGTPLRLSVTGIATNAQFVLNPFAGSLAQLVTWTPGAAAYEARQLTFDGANYNASSPTNHAAPFPLGRIAAIPAGNAARLLLVAADGSQAVVRLTPDGTNAATFFPPAGEAFTGVATLPNGMSGFQLLSGTSATGRSQTARSYKFNSGTGNYDLVQTATLAPVSDLSGAGHVLVYAGEPFAAPNATVLARHRAQDWSSQPVLGASITVTGEVFQGQSPGLGQPVGVNLGPKPAAATHALVSQITPQISVFPLEPATGTNPGAIKASPLPGTFAQGVAVTLSGPAGGTIFYRPGPATAWQTYTQPVWLHRDTRLQAYGSGPGGARTAVFDGWYRFTSPAGQLSTLDDGIPDYVKLGLGFDPAVLPDRSSQTNANRALNYLQILLDGAGVPLRNTSGTALELHLRPWSHDGLAAANIPARVAGAALPDGRPNPGVGLTLHDVSGEPLDSGLANHWGHFGAGQTAAWLREVGRGGRASVTVASTTPAFALDFTPPYDAGTFFQGRELAGLVVLPAASPNTFTHPYGGGSDAAEAAAWRAAAIAYYLTNTPPTLGVTLDPLATALTLVFEQWVTKQLVLRGVLPASYLPTAGSVNTNRLTLTAYRVSEPARPIPASGPVGGLVLPTPEQLAELEQYRSNLDRGYKLGEVVKVLHDTLRDSTDPKLTALRAVTLEVYRISARWGGQFPGAFPAPLDALREFFATGVLPVAYRNDWTNGLPPAFGGALTPLTTNDYASAYAGVAMLVSLPAPRPVVVRDLLVRPDSIGLNCTVLNRVGLGTPVALVTAEGRPFRFPSSFSLVPGVAVRVTAFADAPSTGCAAETLEVIRLGDELLAQVTGVPLPSPTDTDGNLLDDDWERLFLGGLGNDPFASLGGGHTLLQSYLDGTDPMLPGSYGQQPPASLAPPAVEISRLNPTTVQLRWQFSPAYAPRLDFKLQGTTALGASWENLPASVEDLGGGQYRMLASSPTGNTAFWRLTLRLR